MIDGTEVNVSLLFIESPPIYRVVMTFTAISMFNVSQVAR